MNTFIDNTATLVVENCLISDLVDIFPSHRDTAYG